MSSAHSLFDGWPRDVVIGPSAWFEWLWVAVPIALTVGFWLIVGYLALKLLRDRPAGRSDHGSALRILEERYARGEIAREEFLERKAVLNAQPTTGAPRT